MLPDFSGVQRVSMLFQEKEFLSMLFQSVQWSECEGRFRRLSVGFQEESLPLVTREFLRHFSGPMGEFHHESLRRN